MMQDIPVYGDNSWKKSKGSLAVSRGTKSRTLYMLHVTTFKDHAICVLAKQTSLSLWHCQLGHMSIFGMKVLSHLGYVPSLDYFKMFICEHCLYNK